ncbi:MAG: 4-(cytidine 5'-diphospho)-2-C-methyl-D-erythritol kinase, partial [Oscillospiraceae bacterium]
PQAFAAYDTLGEKVKVDTDSLMGAIKHKKLTDIAKYMANDLEKAAGSPDTQPIKEKLLELGALGSLMTGSGSAVFGLFDDEKKAEAAVMYFRGQVKSAFLARPVNFGASVRKDKK